jgi:hypothetical protein
MAVVARIPSQEPALDKFGLFREKWLTFFRGQQEVLAAAPQTVTGGKVQETGQTAAIGTTPVPTGTLVAGLYRVSWYGQVTTAAGVSSDFQVTVTWTRNGVGQSFTGALTNGNTTATYASEGLPQIHVDAGTPVSYAVAYNSNPAAAMAYELNLVLELVSADA